MSIFKTTRGQKWPKMLCLNLPLFNWAKGKAPNFLTFDLGERKIRCDASFPGMGVGKKKNNFCHGDNLF